MHVEIPRITTDKHRMPDFQTNMGGEESEKNKFEISPTSQEEKQKEYQKTG